MIIDLIYHLCNQVFDEYEYHPSHELSPLTIDCTEKRKEKEIISLGLKKKMWDLKQKERTELAFPKSRGSSPTFIHFGPTLMKAFKVFRPM